ncbi:MAG TPA: DUF4384 domain-containing protein [Acidobacteriota bacterium]|nr:DUF4384 domain-containing protein [Acidobacteriota bacterium]
MSRRIFIYLCLIITVLVGTLGVLAAPQQNRGLQPFNLQFKEPVTVLLKQGGTFIPVSRDYPFQPGDQIKFKIQSKLNGFVSILNITPTGQARLLSDQSQLSIPVFSDQSCEIPAGQQAFRFDEERGVELIRFYLSPAPLPNLNTWIENLNPQQTDSQPVIAYSPTSRSVTFQPKKADKTPPPSSSTLPSNTSPAQLRTVNRTQPQVEVIELQLKHVGR